MTSANNGITEGAAQITRWFDGQARSKGERVASLESDIAQREPTRSTLATHTHAATLSLSHARAPAHPLRAGDVALGALRSEIEELASENERLQDLVEAAEEEEVERLRAWAAEAEYTTED